MIQRHIDVYSCEVTVKEGIPAVYGMTINGAKITDMYIMEYGRGCRCSTCNDRNKYDKESETIICKNYNRCFGDIWRRLQEGQKADIKEVVKMAIGD